MDKEELDSYYEYENILERMLNNISSDVDKREGSVIYNAIAPAALELAQMYFVLNNSIDLCFADTAVESYLDRICNQSGVYRKEATKAIRKAEFLSTNLDKNEEYIPLDVSIGERFSIEDIVFRVIEKIQDGIYKVECETAGIVGNNCFGTVLPVGYLDNLSIATLTDILIPGLDAESDEELRIRYYETINEKVFAGNVADYKKKTKEIVGVGAVKVTPIWNGGGTVKLTILDSGFNKASDVLIEKAQNEICPNLSADGLGIAPIGHSVTVNTVENYELIISASVTYKPEINAVTMKQKIEEQINMYLLELRKMWEDTQNVVIRKSQIESRILNIDGVLDISNTTLNENMGNVELSEFQVPVLKEMNLI